MFILRQSAEGCFLKQYTLIYHRQTADCDRSFNTPDVNMLRAEVHYFGSAQDGFYIINVLKDIFFASFFPVNKRNDQFDFQAFFTRLLYSGNGGGARCNDIIYYGDFFS
jgi:hypothetical protein